MSEFEGFDGLSEALGEKPAAPEPEETPPAPAFLVRPTPGQGSGTGVYLADGTPVGQFVAEQMPAASAQEVKDILMDMGLEEEHAEVFARHRAKRDETAAEAMAMPAVKALADAEDERELRLEEVRAAFLKEQRKK